MGDIVETLTKIAEAASYLDGTDSPLGEQIREGIAEIERLRFRLDYMERLHGKVEWVSPKPEPGVG